MTAPTTSMARQLEPCPEHLAFRFRDGQTARDLPSFRDLLRTGDLSTVEFHRNHFHFWLRDVLVEERLAKEAESLGGDPRISAERFRHDLLNATENRLGELQRNVPRRR